MDLLNGIDTINWLKLTFTRESLLISKDMKYPNIKYKIKTP